MSLRSRRLLPALLVAVLAALLAAGCGGDGGGDKEAYQAGMHKVGTSISDASAASSKLPADATKQQRVAAIEAQQQAIADAADAADALDPPKDAAAQHAKLVTALRDYAKLLGTLAKVSGDSMEEAKVIGDIGPVIDRLTKSSTALEKQGYDFAKGSSSK